MKVEFQEGAAGFDEAMELLAMVRLAREHGRGTHDEALLGELEHCARGFIAREEFAALAAAPDSPAPGGPEAAPGPWAVLRQWLGPSRRELELALQRKAALDRAQRAERSAFEALAETARVARERDQALAEVLALEQRVAEIEATHTGVRGPV